MITAFARRDRRFIVDGTGAFSSGSSWDIALRMTPISSRRRPHGLAAALTRSGCERAVRSVAICLVARTNLIKMGAEHCRIFHLESGDLELLQRVVLDSSVMRSQYERSARV